MVAEAAGAPAPDWRRDVFDVLKAAGVKHIAYVPDAGHSTAIRLAEADPDIHSVVLTTEEEGIGYLVGAWLGGERGALLMQSSGVGNCINTLGLVACARFPFLAVVTMRGDWAEFNQHQNPMGQATEAALRLMGTMVWRADEPKDVAPLLRGAATMAFEGDGACAVLLGQRLIGEKEWVK
ncbi:phosphonopyruvate decarboxylase [Falsiroseomonas sp. CW058]|uniref:phosphonopyruvate decarboxylase n=1 Tax=Falsiroseomonas sp. CW058 TaxID=3388664 RepID=UPI003D31C8D2